MSGWGKPSVAPLTRGCGALQRRAPTVRRVIELGRGLKPSENALLVSLSR